MRLVTIVNKYKPIMFQWEYRTCRLVTVHDPRRGDKHDERVLRAHRFSFCCCFFFFFSFIRIRYTFLSTSCTMHLWVLKYIHTDKCRFECVLATSSRSWYPILQELYKAWKFVSEWMLEDEIEARYAPCAEYEFVSGSNLLVPVWYARLLV